MIASLRKIAVANLTAAAVLALAALIPTAADAQFSTGFCTPTGLGFKTINTTNSTKSTAPINVTGGRMNIVQGGTMASCVVVTFSAEAHTLSTSAMNVQVMVDDVGSACPPGSAYFVPVGSQSEGYGTYAMTFVCPSVSPGSHSIQVMYNSSLGGLVGMRERTLIVQYKK